VVSIADEARPVWFAFTELFAFCDLHTTRWRQRQETWMSTRTLDVWVMPQFYDRQGFPIPAEADETSTEPGWMMPTLQWAKLKEDQEYSRVAWDDLPDGSYLSTVWLGLDHNHGCGPPLIFETMRFHGDVSESQWTMGGRVSTFAYHKSLDFPDIFDPDGETTDQLRYMTEEEALAAHHEIVRRIVLREGH